MKVIRILSSAPTEVSITMPSWMYWFFKKFGDIGTNRLADKFEGHSLSYKVFDEKGNIEFIQSFDRKL